MSSLRVVKNGGRSKVLLVGLLVGKKSMPHPQKAGIEWRGRHLRRYLISFIPKAAIGGIFFCLALTQQWSA